MSGGEPSSIKRIFSCAARLPILSFLALVTDIRLVQMWVCDLVMSRTAFLIENGKLKIENSDIWIILLKKRVSDLQFGS